jgi:hypothetical protein
MYRLLLHLGLAPQAGIERAVGALLLPLFEQVFATLRFPKPKTIQPAIKENAMNRIVSTLATALLAISPLAAQTAPAPALAPPMLPLVTVYHYWPIQFVQFVGAELPYALVELDADPGAGKQPLLYATLVDRATGKRIHYTSDDSLIAAATALGEEAHKTNIAFEPADTDNPGSISTVRFTLADGKPLEWRFVQGSDISEQGSGLNPFPEAKIPIFAYREQGAVAGEGTALKIGDTVSTASVWTEISHPPYFVAYRGAETAGGHTLLFLPDQQTWTVTSSPAALTPGATWELDEAHGNHRSIRIDKVDGTHLTVTSTERFQPGVRCTLDVTQTGDTWSIDHARFSPIRDGEKHMFTLQFATPLTTATTHTDLTLIAGKKKVIANGAIAAGATPGHALTLTFSNPAWLNGKSMTEEITVAKGTVSLSAHP